jgi:hypothetical protein
MKIEEIRQLCGVDAKYFEWKDHFYFRMLRFNERKKHIDIYDAINKVDDGGKGNEFWFHSENLPPLISNLTPEDFAYDCPGCPCLFRLLLDIPNGYKNIYLHAFDRMLQNVSDNVWANANIYQKLHDQKINNQKFNDKIHADVDGKGNDIFTFLSSLLFAPDRLNEKLLEIIRRCVKDGIPPIYLSESEILNALGYHDLKYDILDFNSINYIRCCYTAIDHDVDFDMPAPNGKTMFNYFPSLRFFLNCKELLDEEKCWS